MGGDHPSWLDCQLSWVGTIRQGWTVGRALMLDCQLSWLGTILHGWTVSLHGWDHPSRLDCQSRLVVRLSAVVVGTIPKAGLSVVMEGKKGTRRCFQ